MGRPYTPATRTFHLKSKTQGHSSLRPLIDIPLPHVGADPPIAIHHPLLHGRFPRHFSRLAPDGSPLPIPATRTFHLKSKTLGHSSQCSHIDIPLPSVGATHPSPSIPPLLHGRFPRQFSHLALTGRPYTHHADIPPQIKTLGHSSLRSLVDIPLPHVGADPPIAIHHPLLHGRFPVNSPVLP